MGRSQGGYRGESMQNHPRPIPKKFSYFSPHPHESMQMFSAIGVKAGRSIAEFIAIPRFLSLNEELMFLDVRIQLFWSNGMFIMCFYMFFFWIFFQLNV